MIDDRTAPGAPSIVVTGLRIELSGTGRDVVDDVSCDSNWYRSLNFWS